MPMKIGDFEDFKTYKESLNKALKGLVSGQFQCYTNFTFGDGTKKPLVMVVAKTLDKGLSQSIKEKGGKTAAKGKCLKTTDGMAFIPQKGEVKAAYITGAGVAGKVEIREPFVKAKPSEEAKQKREERLEKTKDDKSDKAKPIVLAGAKAFITQRQKLLKLAKSYQAAMKRHEDKSLELAEAADMLLENAEDPGIGVDDRGAVLQRIGELRKALKAAIDDEMDDYTKYGQEVAKRRGVNSSHPEFGLTAELAEKMNKKTGPLLNEVVNITKGTNDAHKRIEVRLGDAASNVDIADDLLTKGGVQASVVIAAVEKLVLNMKDANVAVLKSFRLNSAAQTIFTKLTGPNLDPGEVPTLYEAYKTTIESKIQSLKEAYATVDAAAKKALAKIKMLPDNPQLLELEQQVKSLYSEATKNKRDQDQEKKRALELIAGIAQKYSL